MNITTREQMHNLVPLMNALNRPLLNHDIENTWGLHVVAVSVDNPNLLITTDMMGESSKVLVIDGDIDLRDMDDPDSYDEDGSIASDMVFNIVDEVMGVMETNILTDFYRLFLDKNTKIELNPMLIASLSKSGVRLYVASGYELKVMKIARLA